MRTGLFFGSFNPIHVGHTIIANYMVEYGNIDELWFVVTPHNPLKKRSNLLDDYQRLELVNRAIKDDFRFKAADIEFRLPKPSYTINTLTYLKEKFPKRAFLPIIGSDNYLNFHKWKNSDILNRDFEFLVYPRPNFKSENVELPVNFHVVNAPMIEISSTFIRNAIKEQKDIRHYLNPEVYQYIEEMNFYK